MLKVPAPSVGSPSNSASPTVIVPGDSTLFPSTVAIIVSGHTISIPTAAPPATVVGGTIIQAPPVVVIDGTTATFPSITRKPQPTVAPVLSISIGIGPPAGVILPNGQTIQSGSTIVHGDQTLVLATASTGSSSVLLVIHSSTTKNVVPTAGTVVSSSPVTKAGTASSGSPLATTSGQVGQSPGSGNRVKVLPGAGVAVLGAVVALGL
ncbi:hypothetical protein P280DRAFT_478482 [Massarina eburnea CBS 473.64]|uniref:Uncharacterized protein n=1 Tax=Massarina eburnea CBS 473.64 TaxID=1395130 RepID=A0A6A6S846_9PLEO|nr:hypothetical protein P280DRAFT_478482 [Massarina eburnea CBS 473.64]